MCRRSRIARQQPSPATPVTPLPSSMVRLSGVASIRCFLRRRNRSAAGCPRATSAQDDCETGSVQRRLVVVQPWPKTAKFAILMDEVEHDVLACMTDSKVHRQKLRPSPFERLRTEITCRSNVGGNCPQSMYHHLSRRCCAAARADRREGRLKKMDDAGLGCSFGQLDYRHAAYRDAGPSRRIPQRAPGSYLPSAGKQSGKWGRERESS